MRSSPFVNNPGLRLRVTFSTAMHDGMLQKNEMTAARRIVSIHALMWLVILVKSPLNQTNLHPIDSLKKVILAFKRCFII